MTTIKKGDPGPLSKQIKTRHENHTGVVIYDKAEPRSVYNLVPLAMQQAIDTVDPKFFEFTFKTLERNISPEERDYQLRIAFWREYQHTQDNWQRAISLNAVCKGICAKEYLYQTVMRDPLKMAFIMFPVTDMKTAMEEMMDLGLREMRKILKMPMTGKKGANLPVIREKIKIVALLQNRLKGSVVQRLQTHTRSENVHIHTQEAPKSLVEIEKEIKKLELSVEPKMEALVVETQDPQEPIEEPAMAIAEKLDE